MKKHLIVIHYHPYAHAAQLNPMHTIKDIFISLLDYIDWIMVE
jgi:hypothetical protein